MEDTMKSSSCGASMDGIAEMDVDDITFLAKRLEDEGEKKTNVLRIVLFAGETLLWMGVGWRE